MIASSEKGGTFSWDIPKTLVKHGSLRPYPSGFLEPDDHFGVFWGYHHLRKPPYTFTYMNCWWLWWMYYCWWKKSCTSWYGKCSIICKVLYMAGGAWCLPSTVRCPARNDRFTIIVVSWLMSGILRDVFTTYLYRGEIMHLLSSSRTSQYEASS